MIGDPIHSGGGAAHVLRERCRALGLVTWRFTANGDVVDGALADPSVSAWFESALLAQRVCDGVRARLEANDFAPFQVFEGCWVFLLEERRRRRRLGLIAAIALAPTVFDSAAFDEVCESVGQERGFAIDALRDYAVFREVSVSRLAHVTQWMHHDLAELSTGADTIENLSRQLSESYEEMSLLYKLREYMSELVQPQRFVRQACFELNEVLPYRWVAAWFNVDQGRAPSISEGVFSSGELPCHPPQFRAFATDLIGRLSVGQCLTLDGDERGVLARGASQVLVYPIASEGEVIGAFFVGDKKGFDVEVTNIELKMVEAASGYVAILIENSGLYEEQHAMFLGTVRALTASIDAKDPYTSGHSERVADLAAELARVYGLPELAVERVRIAGLVHDIGKIGVPEEVLRKPGKLTDAEFDMMKAHPAIGYHILQDIPQLGDVLPGVLHHHERYDGRGYPERIGSEDIPLMARIIALADSFDAMSSTRTYRAAMSRERALTEIRRCAGTQFDPVLAELFVKLDFEAYDEAAARHKAERRLGDEEIDNRGAAA